AGYLPTPNKVFKFNPVILPGINPSGEPGNVKRKDLCLFWFEHRSTVMSPDDLAFMTPTNTFILRQGLKNQLKLGATYNLSFKVKGKGARGATWTLGWAGFKETAPPKIERL